MPLYINRKMWTPCFASKQKAASEITATNVSKYDRIEGEKVWLYENNGNYTIVDALGLTSRAFTGVCKENIARNSSGTVEAVVDGELVVRWNRNFSTNGSPTVDDSAMVVSNLSSYNYIYKQYATALSTPTTKVEFSYKFKVDRTYAPGSSNPAGMCFYCTDNYGSGSAISLTTSMNTSAANLVARISNTNYTVISSGAVPANAWVWVKGTITNTSVDIYYSFDGTNWNHPISATPSSVLSSFSNKTFMSVKIGSFYSSSGFYGTVDLAETWVKADSNIVWQPYAPITE